MHIDKPGQARDCSIYTIPVLSTSFIQSPKTKRTVRKFGKSVPELGSALTDIEYVEAEVKTKSPKELYDRSGALWVELENTINDMTSGAEIRLMVEVGWSLLL